MTDYKMVKDVDFSGIGTKRIRVIGYKADHNTACKHFYDAYPLDAVFDDDRYRGLYIVLIRKAVQDGGNDYNGGFYMVFNGLGMNIHVEFLAFYGHDDVDRVKAKLDSMGDYIGKDGFLSLLEFNAGHGKLVKNPELMALDMLGETEFAGKYRAAKASLLAERERREQERREQYRKEQEEEQRRIEEAERAAMESTKEKIRNREAVDNDNGIILRLMRQYGIKVPLRTQGWLLDSLASVTFDGDTVSYRYYKRKNGKGSQKAFDCLRELVKAIDGEVA